MSVADAHVSEKDDVARAPVDEMVGKAGARLEGPAVTVFSGTILF